MKLKRIKCVFLRLELMWSREGGVGLLVWPCLSWGVRPHSPAFSCRIQVVLENRNHHNEGKFQDV